jgi:KaiC/GvpD/RAD55 family RecA-like ATPase
VGKTLFAIFIAKEAAKKKVAYFAVDDTGDKQRIRFAKYANIDYIGRNHFDRYLDELKKYAANVCEKRSIWDQIFKDSMQIEKRKNDYMRELGIFDTNKIDGLFLIELLIEKVYTDAEIIILDSLHGLVDEHWNITRAVINRLKRQIEKDGRTLIIVHHANKKEDYFGSKALGQTVDLVLKFERFSHEGLSESGQRNFRKIKVESPRYAQGTRECVVEMVFDDSPNPDFILFDEGVMQPYNSLEPVERKILNAMKSRDSMTINELCELLPAYKQGTILNGLTKLGSKNFLCKADGQSWKTINKNR